ncbi:unnamed protein product [Polarella glacialis]|uniref:Uncharacterized protein n=1 Tax=Polarella glacialis TaxID=89957 RepID=A0A813KVN3_POLGL|nr:unnamed protein product [Polarella glacialis]
MPLQGQPPRRQRRRALAVVVFAGSALACCLAMAADSAAAALMPDAQPAPVPPARSAQTDDLLVVGAGALGRRVAAQWRRDRPLANIVAATLTTASHDALRAEGLQPVTLAQLEAEAEVPRFRQVLFTAPPKMGTTEPGWYAASVATALKHWDGIDGGGNFVFTSSCSVYSEDAGGKVVEDSPLASSAGALRLFEAEKPVLQDGGCILRLAGLYDARRGPHEYWLKLGVVKGRPEGLINMLHYDDAAAAAAAALARPGKSQGEVFVVADGSPVSRFGICEAALGAKPYAGFKPPTFEAATPPGVVAPPGGAGAGKVLDASKARNLLAWRPRFPSFASYMATL